MDIFIREAAYGENHLTYQLFPDRDLSQYAAFLLRSGSDDWAGAMLRDGVGQEALGVLRTGQLLLPDLAVGVVVVGALLRAEERDRGIDRGPHVGVLLPVPSLLEGLLRLGAAEVAERAVETYGWLTPEQMLNGLAIAEATPGSSKVRPSCARRRFSSDATSRSAGASGSDDGS